MTIVMMIRVGYDQICVIITAGKGDDHSEDVRVGNDQICVIITAGKGDDHSEGDRVGDEDGSV